MMRCLSLLLVLGLSGITGGLRLLFLQVPNSVYVDSEVTLECSFDTEEDTLYSVKWYKDNVEFFRYQANDMPHKQAFDMVDIEVDLDRSSEDTVYLKKVASSAEGTYVCEVSANAPSFQTIISLNKFMAVEERPTASTASPPLLGQCFRVCPC